MKKIINVLKALILACLNAEQNNTESPMEQTDRMAGSNFWL